MTSNCRCSFAMLFAVAFGVPRRWRRSRRSPTSLVDHGLMGGAARVIRCRVLVGSAARPVLPVTLDLTPVSAASIRFYYFEPVGWRRRQPVVGPGGRSPRRCRIWVRLPSLGTIPLAAIARINARCSRYRRRTTSAPLAPRAFALPVIGLRRNALILVVTTIAPGRQRRFAVARS